MTDSPSPATLLDLLRAARGSKVAIVLPETGARITYDSLRRRR